MGPKSKKKNSFYFFMKEMQENEAAKGRRIAIKDMPTYAHPIWAKMSVAEREPYEQLAREHKNDPLCRGPKLASDGTSVAENLRELEEIQRKQRQMINDIRSFVTHGATEEQFKDNTPKRPLYFISFNILCRTETEYIPIEMGLVEYSILHGIHRELHTLIHTGRIPTGYTGEARRLSEDKHGIDIFSPPEDCERSMKDVYDSIKTFINPHIEDSYFPLFCAEDDVEQTKECLKYLRIRARDDEEFDIWNATYLLLELRAGLGDKFKLPPTIATDILTKTCFNYHPGARCSFHDEKDNNNCALAYSKRLCYLLSDAVCEVFSVPLTEGHMPTRAVEEKDYVVTIPKGGANHYRSPPDSGHIRLDQSDNYYEGQPGQFADVTPVRRTPKAPGQPRQPASACLAETTRLKLQIGAATAAAVPGHGIGRGQRRQ